MPKPMIYLLLSISFSVLTVSFFKLFDRFGVNTFQAILANYITCMVSGTLLSDAPALYTSFWNEAWFGWTALLGLLFITGFYTIGLTAQRLGVSVSMVAAKLSVVIPVSLAIVQHGEVLDWAKGCGILLSLLAVVFISFKDQESQQVNRTLLWLLPMYVFVSSGALDSLLNHVQRTFIPPATEGNILTIIFTMAFCWGIPLWLFKREKPDVKSLVWGVALGIPNYFSMFFLVKTLGSFDASYIFPINNTGIVVCSALVSILLFKERMNKRNWIGLAIAVVSIVLIA